MDTIVTTNVRGRELRAGFVTTPLERLECYRMRYREYHDRLGQVRFSEDGLDIDWADSISTLICAKIEHEEVVGTCRHIHAEHGCLLTHGNGGIPEPFSDMPFVMPTTHPRTGEGIEIEQVVEGGRWCAPHKQLPSGEKLLLSRFVLEASMEAARIHGDRFVVTSMVAKQAGYLIQEGWDIVEFMERDDGEPHFYHGAYVRLCLIRVPERSRDFFYRRVWV